MKNILETIFKVTTVIWIKEWRNINWRRNTWTQRNDNSTKRNTLKVILRPSIWGKDIDLKMN